MPLPGHAQLDAPMRPDAFIWAAGIEDTFITAPHPRTGRTLDEYELCGHYARWQEDLALLAGLGLRAARYGIPWHRIQPGPDTWDFQWADGPLQRLLDLGVEPIVDLVHYGLPSWLTGAWLDPRLPEAMALYARRVAERFAGRIRWWTPLNEPRITAWYCGKLGWWPPHAHGWRGYVSILLPICRAIVLTCEALSAVDPQIVHAHVDATDLYDVEDDDCRADADFRQELVFLALDLVSGRVGREHPLRAWLLRQGADEASLAWFERRGVALHCIGLNLYPLFTAKVLTRGPRGLRVRMPYGAASIIDRLAQRYGQRYGRPLWISETASLGERRGSWLADSVAAVARSRSAGADLRGYTWWPLFALVTWGYRQGSLPAGRYLRQMGLYDGDAAHARLPTALVEAFRGHVRAGMPVQPEVQHVR